MTDHYQNPRWPEPEAESSSVATEETIPLVPTQGFSADAWTPWTQTAEATLLDPLAEVPREGTPAERPGPPTATRQASLPPAAPAPVQRPPVTYEVYQAPTVPPPLPAPVFPPAPAFSQAPAFPPASAYRPEHPNAVATGVLGLLGLFTFGLTCPIAWVLGARGRAAMRREPGRWRPSGLMTLGLVLGVLGSLLWLLVVALLMLVVLRSF